VAIPTNAIFGVGLLYLAVNVLSVTLAVSRDADRVRRLAQECALLRAEVEALRAPPGLTLSPRSGGGAGLRPATGEGES
jgi:hypothetical protein